MQKTNGIPDNPAPQATPEFVESGSSPPEIVETIWQAYGFVLPIRADSKRPDPSCPQWPRERPSWHQVRVWHQLGAPRWGLLTGAGSGVVVIDADEKNGHHGLAVLKAWGFTKPHVCTASGGAHFWFRHPGGRILTRTNIADGVDVRGDGGLVVFCGDGYEFRGDPEELSDWNDLPADVRAMLESDSTTTDFKVNTHGLDIPDELRDYPFRPPNGEAKSLVSVYLEYTREGDSRNRVAFNLALALMRKDHKPQDVFELLKQHYFPRVPDKHGVPFTTTEILRAVESAWRTHASKLIGDRMNNNNGGTAADATANSSPVPDSLDFPDELMVGTLGDFAREAGRGNEMPEAFLYFAALTFLGAQVSRRSQIPLAFPNYPRLYTVLVGESADVKKSECIKAARRFFSGVARGPNTHRPPKIQEGLGSAEGLMNVVRGDKKRQPEPNVLLMIDEFQSLLQKASIQASTLLTAVTTLWSNTSYSNATAKAVIDIHDVHLSMIAGCTTDTWANVWTSGAIDIGLSNRVLVVTAGSKPRVSLPEPWDEAAIKTIADRVSGQIDNAPDQLRFTPEAQSLWDSWYKSLPVEPIVKRIDTIALRLAVLIALTTDKREIDAEVIETVIGISKYELRVRRELAPMDAANDEARLEQIIMRVVNRNEGPSKHQAYRKCNAQRYGQGKWNTVLDRLIAANRIRAEQTPKGERLWAGTG